MAKVGTVVIELDANTAKLIKGVKESNRQIGSLRKSVSTAKTDLLKFAGGAIGIYAVGTAFKSLLTASLDFNIQMENAETKLNAMISASKGYTFVSGEQVTTMQRQAIIARETAETMQLLRTANAQTSMGMKDLIDTFAIMKPGMDQVNVSTKDQVEILKLVTNTASTFGLSAQELSTGIDDLARGTYKTTQSFGKMMTAIGVTREGIKSTTDIVGYLSTKMKETGVAQDTWTVAVSNFGVAWDEMSGELTKPIFDNLKNSIKLLTKQMGKDGVQATKSFSLALKEFAKVGVQTIGFVLKAVSQLIHALTIAYKGYQQLGNAAAINGNKAGKAWNEAAVWVGKAVGLDTSEDEADLKGYNDALAQRIEIQKQLTKETKGLVESNNGINKTIEGIVGNFVEYKETAEEVVETTGKLANKNKELETSSKKSGKAQAKALKDAQKEAKKLQDALDDAAQSFASIFQQGFESILRGDFAGGMADIMGDAMSQATSNISGAFSTGLGNLFTGAGSFADAFKSIGSLDIIGSAVSLLGGLLGSTVSQSQIDRASGTSSFDSQGFTDSVDILESAMQPQLTASQGMLQHLKSMDNQFGAIANALSGATGFDYDGSSFEATSSSNWFGGSSTELISAGLQFQEQTVGSFVDGLINVQGFEAILKKSSSFFGLVSSEKIIENLVAVPQGLQDDLTSAFNDGFQSILDSVEILGFDTQAIEAQLQQATIDLGKLNFKDLDAEEKSKLLNDAFSAELGRVSSEAIRAIASPENVQALEAMRLAGEEYSTTLVRVAVGHETLTKQLALFGQVVDDFKTSNALVEAAGGLEAFTSAMDTFVSNFYTDAEQFAFQGQYLTQSLSAVGLSLPSTSAGFRELFLSTQASSIAIHNQINEQLALAEAARIVGNSLSASAYEMSAAILATKAESIDDQYGTLMDNMPDFASYYNAQAQAAEESARAAEEAAEAMEKLRKSLVSIAKLEAVWAGDDISAKKIILDATARETGLTGLTYDNFLEEFKSLTAGGLGLDDETLSAWSDMSSALRAYNDAQTTELRADLSFYNDILSTIRGAYTGNLSYLNSIEQSDYLGRLATTYEEEGNTTGYIQALQDQLTIDKSLSTTKEDYAVKFDNYIEELKKQEPQATLDDVVTSLQDIKNEISDIKDEIEFGATA